MTALRERYIVDESGKKVQVVLDIDVFERLLEELEMLEDVRAYDEAKASGEKPIPLEEALRQIERQRR